MASSGSPDQLDGTQRHMFASVSNVQDVQSHGYGRKHTQPQPPQPQQIINIYDNENNNKNMIQIQILSVILRGPDSQIRCHLFGVRLVVPSFKHYPKKLETGKMIHHIYNI